MSLKDPIKINSDISLKHLETSSTASFKKIQVESEASFKTLKIGESQSGGGKIVDISDGLTEDIVKYLTRNPSSLIQYDNDIFTPVFYDKEENILPTEYVKISDEDNWLCIYIDWNDLTFKKNIWERASIKNLRPRQEEKSLKQWYRHDGHTPYYVEQRYIPEQDITAEASCPTNNTQLTEDNIASFFSENTFNSIIDEVTEMTNIYSAHYNIEEEIGIDEETDEPIYGNGYEMSAIRVGTKSNPGFFDIHMLCRGGEQKVKPPHVYVTIGKYFNYNSSTHVITYDDLDEITINEETFEINEEPTTYDLSSITALRFTADSRFFIYSIQSILTEETESVYHTVVNKEELQKNLQDFEEEKIDPIINQLTIDENNIANLQTSTNILNGQVGELIDTIGTVQIFQLYNHLPEPKGEFLNKIFRLNGILYQCVSSGGSSKDEMYSLIGISGSSEITSSNWNSFASEVNNLNPGNPNFSERFSAIELVKVFRNANSIKLGSSKATGSITLQVQDLMSLNQLEIKLKRYGSKISKFNVILSTDNSTDEKEVEISTDEEVSVLFDNLDLSSEDNIQLSISTNRESSTYEYRGLITYIRAQSGSEAVYTWTTIGGGGDAQEHNHHFVQYKINGIYLTTNEPVYVLTTQKKLQKINRMKINTFEQRHGGDIRNHNYDSDEDYIILYNNSSNELIPHASLLKKIYGFDFEVLNTDDNQVEYWERINWYRKTYGASHFDVEWDEEQEKSYNFTKTIYVCNLGSFENLKENYQELFKSDLLHDIKENFYRHDEETEEGYFWLDDNLGLKEKTLILKFIKNPTIVSDPRVYFNGDIAYTALRISTTLVRPTLNNENDEIFLYCYIKPIYLK